MLENVAAQKGGRAKYPLALKLAAVVSSLLVVMFFGVSAVVWLTLRADIDKRAEHDNDIINVYAARAAQTMLSSLRANALVLNKVLSEEHAAGLDTRETLETFYRLNSDVAALVYTDNIDISIIYINRLFMLANELELSSVETYIKMYGSNVFKQHDGDTHLINAQAGFYSLPILIMRLKLTESAALLVFFFG